MDLNMVRTNNTNNEDRGSTSTRAPSGPLVTHAEPCLHIGELIGAYLEHALSRVSIYTRNPYSAMRISDSLRTIHCETPNFLAMPCCSRTSPFASLRLAACMLRTRDFRIFSSVTLSLFPFTARTVFRSFAHSRSPSSTLPASISDVHQSRVASTHLLFASPGFDSEASLE